MARMRMIAFFDQAAKHRALPLGTGNKTERLLGYFTWHADDSPPINPLGDLFKTQVWALAKHLGVPEEIVDKPASADLIEGQTDEGDFGISYARADQILNWLVSGYSAADVEAQGSARLKSGSCRRDCRERTGNGGCRLSRCSAGQRLARLISGRSTTESRFAAISCIATATATACFEYSEWSEYNRKTAARGKFMSVVNNKKN